MKVLVVKTSSMGDVIHTLPALTDATNAIPGISFDWVVESTFKDVPYMHPKVNRVIVVSIRKWRKNPFKYLSEIRASIQEIKKEQYDVVIDAQGLIKSALISCLANGKKYGLSKTSSREPLASLAYQHKIDVPKGQHAINRVRQLFAKSLGYDFVVEELSYGLRKEDFLEPTSLKAPYLVFLHGTTWASKHWPNEYWRELITLATSQGFTVYLPWGSEQEKMRADKLTNNIEQAHVLPQSSIKQLAATLMHAHGVVGVDSGLAHLAAACGVPAITLYGATSTELTSTMGNNNQALQTDFACSPCMKKDCSYSGTSSVTPACYEMLPPEWVWAKLGTMMSGASING